MKLHTERRRRERALIFGPPKCHKTRCWGDIIPYLGDEEKVYALDTDYRAPQSLEYVEDWEKKVILEQPQTWEELTYSTENMIGAMTPDDWLVIDLIGQPWSYVTTYYIEQVMGKKPHQFFLDFKKGGGKGNPMAGAYGENWQIINALYRDWIMKVVRAPGHVLACAAAEVIDDQDDKEVRKIFGPVGVKPKGQKELGYQFDTVLLTKFGRTADDYLYTSVGDTNRHKVSDQPLNDFALDYLAKIAGWKLA